MRQLKSTKAWNNSRSVEWSLSIIKIDKNKEKESAFCWPSVYVQCHELPTAHTDTIVTTQDWTPALSLQTAQTSPLVLVYFQKDEVRKHKAWCSLLSKSQENCKKGLQLRISKICRGTLWNTFEVRVVSVSGLVLPKEAGFLGFHCIWMSQFIFVQIPPWVPGSKKISEDVCERAEERKGNGSNEPLKEF